MSKLVDLEALKEFKTQMFLAVYPVGSIYMSTNETAPGTLFGGTWEQLKDRFLLSAGDTYTAGDTGGSAAHNILVANLPSHNHAFSVSGTTEKSGELDISASATNAGDHSHTFSNGATNETGSHSHTFTGEEVTTGNSPNLSHSHTVASHSHSLNGHTHSIPVLSGEAKSAGAHSHQQKLGWLTSTGSSSTANWQADLDGATGQTIYTLSSSAVTTTTTSTGAQAINTLSSGSHVHTVETEASTTGGASGSTGSATPGTDSKLGVHTHKVTAAGNISSAGAHTHTVTGTIDANGSHTHTITVSGGDHSHTFNYSGNTENTGSGEALNTMPPYLTVYMWKRTA